MSKANDNKSDNAPIMLRKTVAIGAGKLVASLTAWLKLGAGTSLPGKVARKIDPSLLASFGKQIQQKTI
ncbi:MAG: hypothetical protein K2X66_07505, partial [Cyanobacteria bacterium]|nr:hypothetical protein [Cyanobacteriota bacterium]